MDSNDSKAKVTIVDINTAETVIVPTNLSIDVTQMLVEFAINNNLKLVIEPVIKLK